jgi:hypothetical protein
VRKILVILAALLLPCAAQAAAQKFYDSDTFDVWVSEHGVCYEGITLARRSSGAEGSFGVTIGKDAAILMVELSDWQIRDGALGSVIVAIDGHTWLGQATGKAQDHGVYIVLSDSFWNAFVTGRMMVLKLPNDEIDLRQSGSREATRALYSCITNHASPSRYPFGRDPFQLSGPNS